MLLKVNPHKIEIVKEPVNEREINISKCTFEFADEITNDYVKEAYFTFGGTTYKQIIVNDECDFPSEVLTKKGTVEIGVVAYLVENETEIKRYNPSPAYFDTWVGSLKDNAENSEPITPTDKEQIEQAITDLQNDVADLNEEKQDKLISGENIKTINGESVLGSGNIEIDLSNYYNKQEIDQSQASQNVNISKNADDISTLNNNLTNYSLIVETGSQIVLNVNSSNYQMTAILKDKNGNTIYTSNVIDLPIESMIVNVTYDSTTKEIVFTLQNGTTLRVSVADLVSGLVSTDDLNTILANYYTKTEIDTLLSAKANSNDVYTKSEADTLLGGKVETTTYTQGQATQDANIEENETNVNWLQTLVNQMPTVSGQGTDLSLENVLNYRLMKFLPQGVSSQESTTGKNLLNSITDTTTRNGITFTKNSDGTYTLNGTSTSDIDFNIASDVPLDLNTSYILSGSPNTASNTTYRIMGACTRENDSTTYIADNDGNGVTIPSSKKIRVYINVKNGKTLNNVIFKPMIRLESITDDTYEPYTDGPAPNPSYPFPVKTVTGENSLVIQNENLFSATWQQGAINTNTGVNYGSSDIIRTQGFLYVTPNQHYSFYRSKIGGYINLRCYDNNKNYIGAGTVGANLIQGNTLAQPMGNNDYSCILSFKENVRYVRLMDSTNDLSTQYTMVKGDTPLSIYAEYEEQNYQLSLDNIELNSSPDGTIRDYIYGSPNNWYKKQVIGKVVLDGSESGWVLRGTDTNTYRFTNDTVIANALAKNNTSLYFCNEFQIYNGNSGIANIDDNGIALRDSLNGFTIRILKTLVTGLDNFKTWLSNHNAIEYYLLATPVDVQITDTTLISQLNDIYNNAHSYNGVTNITTTYEDGNEQMYLDIEALKNVWDTSL